MTVIKFMKNKWKILQSQGYHTELQITLEVRFKSQSPIQLNSKRQGFSELYCTFIVNVVGDWLEWEKIWPMKQCKLKTVWN